MRIVVTGGCGNLGSHVCHELVEAGHEVVAVDLVNHREMPCQVRIANLLDREECFQWLAGIETVVHLGNHPSFCGITHAQGYTENVAMNVNVMQAACELGVKKIIYASSIQAMGTCPAHRITNRAPKPALPLNGLEPREPENLYALSKAAGEQMLAYYAERFGIESAAIRFPFLYRKENKPNVTWCHKRTDGWLLLSHIDAAKLVAACVTARLPGFRTYTPSQAENIFQMSIEELLNEEAPDYPLRFPREEIRQLVDVSRITAETGWIPARGIYPE